MSYTALYGYNKSEKRFVQLEEFRNSHGSAAAIWSFLVEKYKIPGFIHMAWEKTWTDEYMEQYEDWEWYTILTTFDKAVLPKEMVPTIVESFRKAQEELKKAHPDHVCSFGAQADALEKWVEEYDHFAWEQTSVSGFLMDGEYDEETDEESGWDLEDEELGHWYIAPREVKSESSAG